MRWKQAMYLGIYLSVFGIWYCCLGGWRKNEFGSRLVDLLCWPYLIFIFWWVMKALNFMLCYFTVQCWLHFYIFPRYIILACSLFHTLLTLNIYLETVKGKLFFKFISGTTRTICTAISKKQQKRIWYVTANRTYLDCWMADFGCINLVYSHQFLYCLF